MVMVLVVQILLQDYNLARGVLIYDVSQTFIVSKTTIFTYSFVHYFSYSSITIVHYFWYLSITIVHYLFGHYFHPLLEFCSSFTRVFLECSSNILFFFSSNIPFPEYSFFSNDPRTFSFSVPRIFFFSNDLRTFSFSVLRMFLF